jgi:hypothetical protein
MQSWLLLLHQIPPKPAYFRAKVSRRLAQVGALPIKNSAYLLPDSEETREDFEWICREITAEGGAAWMFRSESLFGMSTERAEAAFRKLRDADYQELLAVAREVEVGKLAHLFEDLKRIDFFGHPAQQQVEAILTERKQAERRAAAEAPEAGGRVWVTRRGVKVDRIGSAWLIRTFIDSDAVFRFVDTATYQHEAGELRFDMYDGEFTHEGDQCTFEVLLARYALVERYPALQPIAEMVHDIDCKESKFQRVETSGLARMLDGVCGSVPDDLLRVERGGQIFAALYESFRV